MAIFYAITGVYSALLIFMIAKRAHNVESELLENTFLSKEHTDAVKGIAAVGILLSHVATKIKYGVEGPAHYFVVLFTTLG